MDNVFQDEERGRKARTHKVTGICLVWDSRRDKRNISPTQESKKAGIPKQMLRKARERRGWTQQELADKLGTTPLAINRWEQGKTFPSSFYRTKLCDVFETSAEALGLVREGISEAI